MQNQYRRQFQTDGMSRLGRSYPFRCGLTFLLKEGHGENMLRAIISAVLAFSLNGVANAQADRKPAAGAVRPAITSVGGAVVGKTTGLEPPLSTNNKIENPGSKEHKEHIEDLKSKGAYKSSGGNSGGGVISK
ncbi:MAG: hypothetical protein ACREUY_08230 [Burkholderiales bacterium]